MRNHNVQYGDVLFANRASLSPVIKAMNESVGMQSGSINVLRSMRIATERELIKDLPPMEQKRRRIALSVLMLNAHHTQEWYMREFLDESQD